MAYDVYCACVQTREHLHCSASHSAAGGVPSDLGWSLHPFSFCCSHRRCPPSHSLELTTQLVRFGKLCLHAKRSAMANKLPELCALM